MRLAYQVCLIAILAIPSSVRAQSVIVQVDSVQHRIVVTASPLQIPRAAYGVSFKEQYLPFIWPVEGWVRGYEIELVDSLGNKLSRDLLHHAGMANLERRALLSPRIERIFAAGRETEPVLLPKNMGVPITGGSRLSIYYALVNEGKSDVANARLRIVFDWIPANSKKIKNVLPVFIGANEMRAESIQFEIPPGQSSTASEFTMPVSGRFRAIGGHMHDFAREIRLEDVESNRVLVRLKATLGPDGKILGMSRSRFIFTRGGLHLDADHRYRVVAVYDNPGCSAIGGNMGLMVGAFVPDDLRSWPAVDLSDPLLAEDLRVLAESREKEHDHSAMMAEDENYGSRAPDHAPKCRADKTAP